MYKLTSCILTSSIIFSLISFNSSASNQFAENFTSYYASIKSSEVNVRKGPNTRYPIEWVYKKKFTPVEVIAKFEHWYRIKDFNGEEGWVKSAMLTKKRSGIVTIKDSKKDPYANLYDKAQKSSKLIAYITPPKMVDITQCNKEWCQIKIGNLSGWLEKQYLWGVYSNEEFK